MKLPKINLKELEKLKKENLRQRLEFQDRYVEWLKKTSNPKWSSAQKAIINRKSEDSTSRSHRNRSSSTTRNAKRRTKSTRPHAKRSNIIDSKLTEKSTSRRITNRKQK